MGCVCTDHSGGSSSLLSVCFVGKTLRALGVRSLVWRAGRQAVTDSESEEKARELNCCIAQLSFGT